MFGINWRRSHVFFLCCIPTNLWYELLPGLASVRKLTFGCTVSRKWTRQLRHLDSINSSLRLVEGFLDTRLLISHHYEDAIQLIHVHYIGLTMSVALLREGGKYYRQCKFFKSFRDFSEMSIFGCHKKLTSHKLTSE